MEKWKGIKTMIHFMLYAIGILDLMKKVDEELRKEGEDSID